MGNCQAVDAATLVIQHPSGKVDKFYWPMSASEIMRMNPGHYVALLISTTLYHSSNNDKCPDNSANNVNPVRLTRIKLLRPTDTLVLGQVYRLITTLVRKALFLSLGFYLILSYVLPGFWFLEVMKGLCAKKHAKMKKNQQESAEKPFEKAGLRPETVGRRSEPDKENKAPAEINTISQLCCQIKDMAAFITKHLRGCKLRMIRILPHMLHKTQRGATLGSCRTEIQATFLTCKKQIQFLTLGMQVANQEKNTPTFFKVQI
ncbi:Uncharacterized protein TCM_011995 isoform 2 [Theobroma cacao]|uniref:Uncharacterized protein isoform 2 n=1 Tax=Theobroma cacao TaxID=3641 RepID=A0A061FTF1_THECC|nr:Uncharacterized protein TCM_011995 isoform 2 [Theobroma cacao]